MIALTRIVLSAGVVVMTCASGGCGKTPAPESQKAVATVGNAEHSHGDDADHTATAGHDHSGWWCDEHGVPEEECGQCSAKLAAAFQKKGDWCKDHDRPDSQCFVCHPEKEAAFAARYEAKYGKQPPKPEKSESDS